MDKNFWRAVCRTSQSNNIDTFDNSYLLGRYIGAVDLDPSPNGTYIVNGGKCYISKLDSTGIFSGAFSFSTPNVFGGLIGEFFAYDNNDNIIMTGF
ncbi:MAG: hypothetical protein IPL09_00020 [Bacteroidetes bacterium]|nr:hypothetical protein [Bacteroidota bacterium]